MSRPELTPQPQRRTRAFAATASAAVLLIVALASVAVVSHQTASPTRIGTVSSPSGAQFVHSFEEAGAPERVTLDDGTIELSVLPLESGRRFLVVTDDAEIEVRGTQLTVEAVEGVLTRVSVFAGQVEIRRGDGAPVVLDAEQSWHKGEGRTAREEKRDPARSPLRGVRIGDDAERPDGWTARDGDDSAPEVDGQSEDERRAIERAQCHRSARQGPRRTSQNRTRRPGRRPPGAHREDERGVRLTSYRSIHLLLGPIPSPTMPAIHPLLRAIRSGSLSDPSGAQISEIFDAAAAARSAKRPIRKLCTSRTPRAPSSISDR